MRIVVLVKQVPDTDQERRLDPASGAIDRATGGNVADEINERALEVALRHKDLHRGTEVVVLSMGPDSVTKALRKALSMGADSAVHILDDALAGADVGRTAAVLAAAVRKTGFDLLIGGNESTDGRGGVVPAMVAEHLGLPHLSFLNSVEIAEHGVTGVRGTEGGTMGVSAPLPAVLSVTERSAEARFPNFKGIMTAKRKPLDVLSLADLGLDPDTDFTRLGRSVVLATTASPVRTAGKKIVDDGNAGAELAEFLAAGRLI
ncbi:electron transfer flavoprotein subunit beta/FixA family protein [Arthrobacter sp. UYEF36]|uniref:electron transfer flavoprotein subunit beta/FixA family protein n=1 Tax=Arthrobacter sp. UYEF36 TaxID=1756366 RepID=UPI00339351C1